MRSKLAIYFNKARLTACHYATDKLVFVSGLVSFYVRRGQIANTSITVAVDAFAQRHPSHEDCVRVTEGVLIYMALDGSGRPRRMPREIKNPRTAGAA